MKALVYKASGCNVEDKLVPELSVNSVLIELKYSAICRTDLYVARGSIPTQEGRIFGHEASGVIVDIGHKVDVKLKGKKVAIIPLRGCGKCLNCNTSHMHLCSEHQFMGIDYDGVFAEYLVLPSSEVIVVPNDLSFQQIAYIEPLAATLGVIEALPQKQSSIGILGNGRIAQLTLDILNYHGYTDVEKVDSGSKCKVVIECSADSESLLQAVSSLEPTGLLVLKSRSYKNIELPQMEMIKKRIRTISVYYSSFASALKYLQSNKEEIDKLIGTSYALEDFTSAFQKEEGDENKKHYFMF